MHLWRLATDANKELPQVKVDDRMLGSTVTAQDEGVYQTIASDIAQRLNERKVLVNESEQSIVVTADNRKYAKTVPAQNVMCRVGGGKDCNAFTIRIAYDILVYNTKHLLVAKDMADAIKNVIEPDREIPEEISEKARRCYLEPGDSYANEYGKQDVFLTSSEALKKMIEEKSRRARKNFEKYDLDWKL
ncbi:MAG: hypothetical protein SOU49_05880 [Sodaliphilus pleomorphus]|uniref:hypothetical protein n=1 Tax=Sodaliphilus pleomorphus TaxID=2606626 RepID=UPI002A7607A8|nr:hypothetical protein [Sodaliphilus pleomorphus]MDY2832255.1 hypothetical protein [Sodaliphilus pleomorphus]